MKTFTKKQKVFILKNYYQRGESVAALERAFKSEYGKKNCPSSMSFTR